MTFDLKRHIALRESMCNAYAALQSISKMWPGMDIDLWQRYSLLLTHTRKEAEEKRLASIVETQTVELPALPKHISTRLLLFGEDVAQVAIEEEQERHTDPMQPHATRKLNKEWFIETEQRAAVKREEVP